MRVNARQHGGHDYSSRSQGPMPERSEVYKFVGPKARVSRGDRAWIAVGQWYLGSCSCLATKIATADYGALSCLSWLPCRRAFTLIPGSHPHAILRPSARQFINLATVGTSAPASRGIIFAKKKKYLFSELFPITVTILWR